MQRLLMLACLVSMSQQDVINTAQGKLRGTLNDGFVSYHGIPYGTIRDAADKFKQAGLAPSWSGIRESQKATCTARSAEECLQLDVHVPSGAGAPWPVLAWVAGGVQYNPARLVQHGVIVVIVHHRFGPIGFLCTNEEQIPGNAGAKDVVSALRWVRDNIVAFRGNPAKVVVGGQSFGAAIVEGLMLSTMAEGLFHGVIMQSGTLLSPWAFNYDARERARLLGRMYSDRDSMASFLQKSTNKDLADKADRLNSSYFSFGMCAEKPFKKTEIFLSAPPFDLLSNGKAQKVPLMIGFNSDEGYVFAETLNRVKILKKMVRDFNVLLPDEIKFLTEREVQQVKELYFGDKVNMTDVLAYHSDVYFVNHVHRSARMHAAASDPVYYYRFSHSGAAGVEEEPRLPKTGAAHSDELAYLFADKGRELDGEDGEVQRRLIELWTSFVKYLKPSGADVQWAAAEARRPHLLNINSELTMTEFPHERACRFWDEVYERHYYNKLRNDYD